MAGLIRVALVDDHPATARGLAEILSAEPDIEIVGVVGDLTGARGLVDDRGSPGRLSDGLELPQGSSAGSRILTVTDP